MKTLKDFFDFLTDMRGYLISMVVIFVFVLVIGLSLQSASCRSLSVETSMQTKFTVLNGCFVKIHGRWIPERRWLAEDE